MAKVTFIDPQGWQGYVSGDSAYPNIGIGYLASSLIEKGHNVSVIDLNNALLTTPEVLNLLERDKPDLIGLSVKTATVSSANILAKNIKECFPTIPVIAGGPHITLNHQIIKQSTFDYILLGEGEEGISIICDRIDNNELITSLTGVISTNDYCNSSLPNRVENLNKLPFPDYSLFPGPVKSRLKTSYPLVTSRGCPYQCVYCSVPLISGKTFRVRSISNLIDELNYAITQFGIRGFEIVDDVFNFNMQRSKEFCKRLVQEGFGLNWYCENGIRADRIDPELAKLMYKSGCRRVSVGVESGNPDVFHRIKKGETLEQIEGGIHMLNDAGIEVRGFFIIGLPGDSVESVLQSIDFSAKNNIVPVFNMLNPYPGTELFNWAEEQGKFIRNTEMDVHFNDEMKDKVAFETNSFMKSERLKAWELAHFRTASFGMLWPKSKSIFYKIFMFCIYSWKYNIFKTLSLPFFRKKFIGRIKRLYKLSELQGGQKANMAKINYN